MHHVLQAEQFCSNVTLPAPSWSNQSDLSPTPSQKQNAIGPYTKENTLPSYMDYDRGVTSSEEQNIQSLYGRTIKTWNITEILEKSVQKSSGGMRNESNTTSKSNINQEPQIVQMHYPDDQILTQDIWTTRTHSTLPSKPIKRGCLM